jgi:hypothetical protein
MKFDRLKRRKFINLLGGAVAWPLGAGAQQAGKIYRIGFLGVTSLAEYGDRVEAVRTGLRRLGYEEGKNIVIHYRWADGRYDRLPELAAELVHRWVAIGPQRKLEPTPPAGACFRRESDMPHLENKPSPDSTSQQPGARVLLEDFRIADVAAQRLDRSVT